MPFSRLPTVLESSSPAARFALGACSAMAFFHAHIDLGDHRDRRRDQHRAQHPLHVERARDISRAPAEHQREQDDRRAGRVRQRDQQRAQRRAGGGADGDHGRQDRPRARGVDEPQRRADRQPDEPVASVLRPEPREPRQRRLDPRGEGRHRQRHAEHEQDHDRQVAQDGVAEPDAADDLRQRATVSVKVTARPSTIPSGRRRPPVAPADSSAGRTGSTHGLTAVPAPATRAKISSRATRPDCPGLVLSCYVAPVFSRKCWRADTF